MVARLALGSGLFVGSLAIGWWLGARGWLTEAKAQPLIRYAVKWLSPVVLCLSFWGFRITGPELLLLPVAGGVVALSTLLPAFGYARWARLPPAQTGSFLTCAMFSNLGYFGVLIAFAFFGELGYSVAVLYIIHFSPCFYLVGFTLAKRFGRRDGGVANNPFADELRFRPFVGMALGVLLNLARVPRPAACALINQALIPLGTVAYLIAIGSQMSFEPLGRWWRPCLAMSAIKFLYTPLIGWGVVRLFRMEGVPRFVVLLQASMPVAVSPVLLAALFGMDRKCASALWLFTTLVAIPWMWVYLPLIRGF